VPRTGFDEAEGPDDSEPEELRAWLASGFGREDAEVWRRWRFTLAQADAWRREGVGDGLLAAQWQTAGATPDTVRDWQAVDIDAPEAVRWHEFGFNLDGAKGQLFKLRADRNEKGVSRDSGRRLVGSGSVPTRMPSSPRMSCPRERVTPQRFGLHGVGSEDPTHVLYTPPGTVQAMNFPLQNTSGPVV